MILGRTISKCNAIYSTMMQRKSSGSPTWTRASCRCALACAMLPAQLPMQGNEEETVRIHTDILCVHVYLCKAFLKCTEVHSQCVGSSNAPDENVEREDNKEYRPAPSSHFSEVLGFNICKRIWSSSWKSSGDTQLACVHILTCSPRRRLRPKLPRSSGIDRYSLIHVLGLGRICPHNTELRGNRLMEPRRALPRAVWRHGYLRRRPSSTSINYTSRLIRKCDRVQFHQHVKACPRYHNSTQAAAVFSYLDP